MADDSSMEQGCDAPALLGIKELEDTVHQLRIERRLASIRIYTLRQELEACRCHLRTTQASQRVFVCQIHGMKLAFGETRPDAPMEKHDIGKALSFP